MNAGPFFIDDPDVLDRAIVSQRHNWISVKKL